MDREHQSLVLNTEIQAIATGLHGNLVIVEATEFPYTSMV